MTENPRHRVFCAKSAELLENERVDFLKTAKKRKRVRKSVKGKSLSAAGSEEWREVNSQIEGAPTTASVSLLGTLISMVKREWRSTRVAM